MTSPTTEPSAYVVSSAVLPGELLEVVRASRVAAAAAEVQVYRAALAWASAHPDPAGERLTHASGAAEPFAAGVLDEAGEPVEPEAGAWIGLPAIAWDAAAPFAAANEMSTAAGRGLLRDVLVVRHRLPRLHRRVLAGLVPVWRARRVAQAVAGRPDDVCAAVDLAVEERAGLVGPVVLDRIVAAAVLALHAEELELAAAAETRHATLVLDAPGALPVLVDEGILAPAGLARFEITADLADLRALDATLAALAAALDRDVEDGEHRDPLDVRCSRAVGILADPAAALALLAGSPGETGWTSTASRRRVELVVHLSDLALLGADPVARCATPDGEAVLVDAVRSWCAVPGTTISVLPVADPTTAAATDAYQPTAVLRRVVQTRDAMCLFPWCTRPAIGCDVDHVEPFDPDGPPGQTSAANLACLCRHHHRLKTLAGWTYQRLGPPGSSTYVWTDPHGQVYLREPRGSRILTRVPGAESVVVTA